MADVVGSGAAPDLLAKYPNLRCARTELIREGLIGGGERSRTAVRGFAVPRRGRPRLRLTTPR